MPGMDTRKWLPRTVMCALAIGLLGAACGDGDGSPAVTPTPTDAPMPAGGIPVNLRTITVSDTGFAPGALQVPIGTQVFLAVDRKAGAPDLRHVQSNDGDVPVGSPDEGLGHVFVCVQDERPLSNPLQGPRRRHVGPGHRQVADSGQSPAFTLPWWKRHGHPWYGHPRHSGSGAAGGKNHGENRYPVQSGAADSRFGLAPAAAQAPAQSVRATSPVSVVGRDLALSVAGNLAPACAGQNLDAGLFVRDRADPKVITPFESLAATSASTVMNSDGTFAASIPLPRELPDGPTRVWPGVQSDCLDTPIVDDSLGVELAVLDRVRNPGSTSTILLSSAALASVSNGPDKATLGAFLGSVDVRADGESCARIMTDSVSAGSAPLTLRLGERTNRRRAQSPAH